MSRVVAYHPEIRVECPDGSSVAVEVDLDDWYEEKEVLSQVALAVGARTGGELVAAAESGYMMSCDVGPVLGCRVVGGSDVGGHRVGHRVGWFDPLKRE